MICKLHFLLFICLFFLGCNNDRFVPISSKVSPDKDIPRELLITELRRLEEWKIRMESVYDSTNIFMFNNKLVMDLIENPYLHFRLLEQELFRSDIDLDLKLFWIQLSQCLNDSDYFSLIEKSLLSDLSNNEKAMIIKAFLSPGFEWGTRFDDNYSLPKYKGILEKLRAQKELEMYLADTIELIQNGTNASYLKAHRGVDGAYPRISCGR